jgi:hypothetical protein
MSGQPPWLSSRAEVGGLQLREAAKLTASRFVFAIEQSRSFRFETIFNCPITQLQNY